MNIVDPEKPVEKEERKDVTQEQKSPEKAQDATNVRPSLPMIWQAWKVSMRSSFLKMI
jgi:hypothetical protein